MGRRYYGSRLLRRIRVWPVWARCRHYPLTVSIRGHTCYMLVHCRANYLPCLCSGRHVNVETCIVVDARGLPRSLVDLSRSIPAPLLGPYMPHTCLTRGPGVRGYFHARLTEVVRAGQPRFMHPLMSSRRLLNQIVSTERSWRVYCRQAVEIYSTFSVIYAFQSKAVSAWTQL